MQRLAAQCLAVLVLGFVDIGWLPAADKLNASIGVQADIVANAAASQVRIDKVHEKTQSLLAEYSSVTRELESLRRYDDHLERMVQEQEGSIAELELKFKDVAVTHREVVPLMSRMVESLNDFIELDTPFLIELRQRRAEDLREIIDSPDISTAEKYRRILDAYRIEAEYGRTVEAYRGALQSREDTRSVEFLRVGRIVFIYRTLDGFEAGFWERSSASWKPLPDDYRIALAKAFRVARKHTAPDLLQLPVSAPELSL